MNQSALLVQTPPIACPNQPSHFARYDQTPILPLNDMDDTIDFQLDHHRHLRATTCTSFDFVASSTPAMTATRCNCSTASPCRPLHDISRSDSKIILLSMASTLGRRVILITGCSSGIGRATALRFAGNGWLVAASFRNIESAAASELSSCVAMVVKLDLTDGDSIANAVAQVKSQLLSIDAVVNCAGTALVGPIERCTHAQLTRAMITNVAGPLSLIGASMEFLRKSKGVVVVISSALGRAPLPLTSAYCACKAALDAGVQGLAAECSIVGVRLKCIAPGRVIGTNFMDNAERAGSDIDAVYGKMTERALTSMQMDGGVACSTAEQVAECVWNVVNNAKDHKIHRIVGDDAKALIAMRSSMTDEQLRDELIIRFHLN